MYGQNKFVNDKRKRGEPIEKNSPISFNFSYLSLYFAAQQESVSLDQFSF